MKTDGLRILGWVIPIVCMAIAGWVLYGQNQTFAESRIKHDQANNEFTEAQKEFELYKKLKPSSRYAAEDDTALEETAFLNFLRTRCAADGVEFDKWQTQTVIYGKDKGATPADPKIAELLKGIHKKSSTITFVGEYANVRKLLGELEASDRLYTLTNLSWAHAKQGTTLTMTVSRYVVPPSPLKPGEPNPSATPGNPASAPPVAGTPLKSDGRLKAAVPMRSVVPGEAAPAAGTIPLTVPHVKPTSTAPPRSPRTALPLKVSPGVNSNS